MRDAWWSKWHMDHQDENEANQAREEMGRGDPAQGDLHNDRRTPGGTQPRRTEPARKGNKSVPMQAYPGEQGSV